MDRYEKYGNPQDAVRNSDPSNRKR